MLLFLMVIVMGVGVVFGVRAFADSKGKQEQMQESSQEISQEIIEDMLERGEGR